MAAGTRRPQEIDGLGHIALGLLSLECPLVADLPDSTTSACRTYLRVASSLGGEPHGPFDRGRGGPDGWVVCDEPELPLKGDALVPTFRSTWICRSSASRGPQMNAATTTIPVGLLKHANVVDQELLRKHGAAGIPTVVAANREVDHHVRVLSERRRAIGVDCVGQAH